MKIFIGLVGRIKEGLNSASRGEGRWALNLVRCLKDYGHHIVIAPDMELAEWGSCPIPPNVRLIQAYEKRLLNNTHFDIAIFTSWSTNCPEAQFIHADKYVWGVMGWKNGEMVDGYFYDNEYVARWIRNDVDEIPYPINFKDRCFLLAQPFGKKFEDSKFDNHRLAWVAKEAFLPEMNPVYSIAAQKHLFAMVDACKETGYGMSIFCANELDPARAPRVKELGILEKLNEISDVKMYPPMPYPEYQRELMKCSVTVPFTFHGSSQEVVFNGVVPMLYRDSALANHVWTGNTCSEMTFGKYSRMQSEADRPNVLTQEEVKNILVRLLTDKVYYTECLHRLRPMVLDNIDDHVVYQLDQIMKHKITGTNLRK